MEVCQKCKKIFETHDRCETVKCSGICLGEFHYLCTNLQQNEISCLKLSTNIKWFCDNCLISGSLSIVKNDRNENITGRLLKQFEIQENLLFDIQNRLKQLENERNFKNGWNGKAKDINTSPVQSGKRKKLIILGVFVTTALLILATVLGIKTLNDSKSKLVLGNSEESRINIPINSTIDIIGSNANDDSECSGNGTLCLIDRDVWRAHPQKNPLDKQDLPLHRVIISHTATETCDSLKFCIERVRIIQEFHMNSFEWDDIGYNFLISSDGRVYVGRGWDAVGAHTKGYNKGSVGITFIGTYVKAAPTDAQLKACLALLEEGVRLKKLVPNYHLYGARQFAATESPGDILYKIIKKWPHWSVDINLP